MHSLNGVTVKIVPPGYGIIDARGGQLIIVGDDELVMFEGVAYCTQAFWDVLRDLIP